MTSWDSVNCNVTSGQCPYWAPPPYFVYIVLSAMIPFSTLGSPSSWSRFTPMPAKYTRVWANPVWRKCLAGQIATAENVLKFYKLSRWPLTQMSNSNLKFYICLQVTINSQKINVGGLPFNLLEQNKCPNFCPKLFQTCSDTFCILLIFLWIFLAPRCSTDQYTFAHSNFLSLSICLGIF